MKSYGLAIDPGMSTGICLFSWSDEQDGYYRQEGVWQVAGGAGGLDQWIAMHYFAVGLDGLEMILKDGKVKIDALVVEKFTPRQNENFALTQSSVEPLRCEGVLIGHGFERYINWQQPSQQYFMGGESAVERKKRSREFLKLNGLHLTGSHVGQKDADDAISAQLHAIAWLRRIRHMPTLVEFFQD